MNINTSFERVWAPAPRVAERFGITDRTLRRWEEDPSLRFPRSMIINGRKFFRLDEIEAFERRQVRVEAGCV